MRSAQSSYLSRHSETAVAITHRQMRCGWLFAQRDSRRHPHPSSRKREREHSPFAVAVRADFAPGRRLNSLQILLIRIGPFESVDLAEAEPHGVIPAAALLQRVLRVAERHVDLAHLDAVLAGIADDLRRGVKPHRLRIQQPAAERVGMEMLQP